MDVSPAPTQPSQPTPTGRVATALPWTAYEVVNPRAFGKDPVASVKLPPYRSMPGKRFDIALGKNVLRYESVANAERGAELASYFVPAALAVAQDKDGRGVVTYLSGTTGGKLALSTRGVDGTRITANDQRLRSIQHGNVVWNEPDGRRRADDVVSRPTARDNKLPGEFTGQELVELSWTSSGDPDVRTTKALRSSSTAVFAGISPWDAFLGASTTAALTGSPIAILNSKDGFYLAQLAAPLEGVPRHPAANMVATRKNDALEAIVVGNQVFDFSGAAGMLG
jgi:hypothetical protein